MTIYALRNKHDKNTITYCTIHAAGLYQKDLQKKSRNFFICLIDETYQGAPIVKILKTS